MKTKPDWLNILDRAAWTFAEGFLVALPAASQLGMDAAAWKAALIGAAMAGLSALKTLALEVIKSRNQN